MQRFCGEEVCRYWCKVGIRVEWRVKFDFSEPGGGTRGKILQEYFPRLEMLGFGSHLRRGSMDKMTNNYFMSLLSL